MGLDSAEVGIPAEKFRDVFERAAADGPALVAHAGEEGRPEYIWQALDAARRRRIDHGVRCLEDARLVERLRGRADPAHRVPAVERGAARVVGIAGGAHAARDARRGVRVTVNSDDPAYFGGYVGDNYAAERRRPRDERRRTQDAGAQFLRCRRSSPRSSARPWKAELETAAAGADG